jgi:hypothetical protein
MKSIYSLFFAGAILVFSTLVQAEKITNKRVQYFNGAINLVINGQTDSSSGVFIAEIKDSSGNPYPAMTAQWISASIEMATMDMGVTKAAVIDDGSARVKIQPKFSMSGKWKLNIKLTTAAGSESRAITFNVP